MTLTKNNHHTQRFVLEWTISREFLAAFQNNYHPCWLWAHQVGVSVCGVQQYVPVLYNVAYTIHDKSYTSCQIAEKHTENIGFKYFHGSVGVRHTTHLVLHRLCSWSSWESVHPEEYVQGRGRNDRFQDGMMCMLLQTLPG